MTTENKILAIPSQGRLKDESLDLAKRIVINFEYPLGSEGIRNLTSEADLVDLSGRFVRSSERFTVALLRPKDIVRMVASARIPLGIVGQDTVEEYYLSGNVNRVQTLLPLGIGRCRLVLAAPVDSEFKTEQEFESNLGLPILRQFRDRSIATSYPNLTWDYFLNGYAALDSGESPGVDIWELSGSVEAAPALGMADAISDLVETGKTLADNGLREIETIFESQAVLITNYLNKKGDNRFVDKVRDAIFYYLLRTGNPDAVARQRRYEALIASFR